MQLKKQLFSRCFLFLWNCQSDIADETYFLCFIFCFMQLQVFPRSSRGGSYFCRLWQKYAKTRLVQESRKLKPSPLRFVSLSLLATISAHLCDVWKLILIGDVSVSPLYLTAALFRTSLFKTAFHQDWPQLCYYLYALYISHFPLLQFTHPSMVLR